MKLKIFFSRLLPDSVMSKFYDNFEVKANTQERGLTKEELLEGVKWCDILICFLNDTIDESVIRANPSLKGICNYAVGYNNIDVKCASKYNIPVCNTPGVLTQTTADLAWALLMACARKIPESDKFVRQKKI